VKEKFPQEVFEKTWISLFHCMWVDHVNITVLDSLGESLKQTGFFSRSDIECIVRASGEKEWKDNLMANTKKALDQGAFGAPWHWVKNSEGEQEPFFGSDRWVTSNPNISLLI
jgi:glutathione S-transferase kappa 1